jgi:ethanolamine ammonia-lyase small subunit
MAKNSLITPDPWQALQAMTRARIALGRAGGSLPTHEWLAFKSAHAAARDAVHNEFDAKQLAGVLAATGLHVVVVNSLAGDRLTFLQRPDLGRQLDEPSRYALQQATQVATSPDLVVVVSDGLSALAAERHAPPLLAALLPMLNSGGWRIAPIVIARFGRVALQDDIGQVLGAQLSLILIGERPGLGSPDSLGAYLVHAPRPGNTDANRNCVSNIRPEGLPCDVAAETIHYLLTESRRRHLSGIQLKDQRALASG